MDLFEQLRVSVVQQSEAADFPSWLLADVLAIAGDPESYADRSHLVESLLVQVRNFDSYAGTGCFDTSVGAETIARTIRMILCR